MRTPRSFEASNPIFPTTHWTTLLKPIGERTESANAALEKLMNVYRKPIVRFTESIVRERQQAEDIAHDFILRLIERGDLAHADRSKGRFRSYLAKSIEHFVIDHYAAQDAKKRKQLNNAVSLDDLGLEPSQYADAAVEFTRQWWRATLDEAEARLRVEWTKAGKGELFEDLMPLLWDRSEGLRVKSIGQKHRMNPTTVSVRKLRMADRFREILTELVAETVGSSGEVQEELTCLLKEF